MNMLSALFAWWRRFRRRKKISRVIVVASMADVPNNPGGALYVVGDPVKPKWASLACPCRCGERIDVNLMTSRKPVWTLHRREGTISLHPSLWMPEEKCGAHFWLRDDIIHWV